jgi:hypothetical protein
MTTRRDIEQQPKSQLPAPSNLPSLQHNAGALGRFMAARVTRKEAARALAVLQVEFLQTQARIAQTELATTEGAVRGALAANALSTIAVLAEDAATQTGAIRARFVTLAGAERIKHVQIRAENYRALEARQAQNCLSADETAVLKDLADADLAIEVECTNVRSAASKGLIECAHETVVNALKEATKKIR